MTKYIRYYKSIYFQDGLINQRTKRDVTLSFNKDDELFSLCKDLNSSEVKVIIGVESYSDLVQKAREEDRTISNFIKHRLKKHFNK